MAILALVIQLGAALVLLLSGALKLAEPSGIVRTIQALGLPGDARRQAAALGLVELITAGALVLAPGSLAAGGLVLALGLAFAVAGAIALAGRIDVHCACMGEGFSGRLGWRQVALLPAWVLVAGAAALDRAPLLAGRRPELLIGLTLVVALGALARMAPLAREHRTLVDVLDGR